MKVVEQSFSCTAYNAAHCGGWKRSDRESNCAVLFLVIQLECLTIQRKSRSSAFMLVYCMGHFRLSGCYIVLSLLMKS